MSTAKDGQELLVAVLEAHGGLSRWNLVEKIRVVLNFYGAALELKGMICHSRLDNEISPVSIRKLTANSHVSFSGYPGTRQLTITLNSHGEPSTVITGLEGNPQNRWLFKAQHNAIESPDGTVIQERYDPRLAFEGHERSTPWDELHLLYFASYALYNYLTAPFIFTLPGFEVSELNAHSESGEVWRVLKVTHPDGFPTHTKIQKFYFDNKEFLLRRIDYETDVAKGVASHYCFDYKNFGGIVIPTMRRVVRRLPDGTSVVSGPTSFGLQYIAVEITDNDGAVHSEGTRVT